MNNKGFTVIELLSVLLILSIIGGIGAIAYNSIYSITKDNYYRILKSNILLAGNDYFENHRGDIIGTTLKVSIERLVNEEYIDEVKDQKGNICNDGYVIKYKGDDQKFHYELCIKCEDYVNYNEICE